jgi:hypothetical protein
MNIDRTEAKREYERTRLRRIKAGDYEPYLLAGTLARFADLLTWRQILALDRTRSAGWWRLAVAEAEHRGLLCWYRAARAWGLTDEGRRHTRDVS